jgi:hypothetical protein
MTGPLTPKERYLELHVLHLSPDAGWGWDQCSTRGRILYELGFRWPA